MYVFVLVLFSSVQCFSSNPSHNSNDFFIKKIVKECTGSDIQLLCFTNKAAKTIERSMDWDITLFDGIRLLRNKEKIDQVTEPRTGFNRLSSAFTNFLNTHYFSVDLTDDNLSEVEARRRGGGGGGGGFGGGGFGYSSAALRKEGKYVRYAFMVLLGIFGLTGPLVMKTLAVMAAKALIASKMALIIVGSVALKKIFEKDHDKPPSVKVHTIGGDDDHDRIYAPSKTSSWLYNPYIKPT